MALGIKFRAVAYTAGFTDRTIQFEDLTGLYDVNDNPLGYGGINPARLDLGIFIVGSAYTVLSKANQEYPINYTLIQDPKPSGVDGFFMESDEDGNYIVQYIGLENWDSTTAYLKDQAIHFNELMYISNVDVLIGETDPSVNINWDAIGDQTSPSIREVIDNPSMYTRDTGTYPGNTIVLSTVVSDRRYVDMVTARENLTCFYEGTLDKDVITEYRVLLYGAKANAFVECDVNGVFLLRGCDDLYKAAKIKCSNLL